MDSRGRGAMAMVWRCRHARHRGRWGRVPGMKRFLVVLLLAASVALPAHAGTVCRLTFSMTGWSFFYKTAEGTGTISCENGQSANVSVWSKGGGVTFGRS